MIFVLGRSKVSGRFGYFQFWLFAWTNAVLKYKNLRPSDFDIEGVDENFNLQDLIPAEYISSAKEDIPKQKIKAQLRATTAQLNSIIKERTINAN